MNDMKKVIKNIIENDEKELYSKNQEQLEII